MKLVLSLDLVDLLIMLDVMKLEWIINEYEGCKYSKSKGQVEIFFQVDKQKI